MPFTHMYLSLNSDSNKPLVIFGLNVLQYLIHKLLMITIDSGLASSRAFGQSFLDISVLLCFGDLSFSIAEYCMAAGHISIEKLVLNKFSVDTNPILWMPFARFDEHCYWQM